MQNLVAKRKNHVATGHHPVLNASLWNRNNFQSFRPLNMSRTLNRSTRSSWDDVGFSRVMVCFHWPTPISIKLGSIIMCRTVSTEPIPIAIVIPVIMCMGTVPNLTLILVLIMWFVTDFQCYFAL